MTNKDRKYKLIDDLNEMEKQNFEHEYKYDKPISEEFTNKMQAIIKEIKSL